MKKNKIILCTILFISTFLIQCKQKVEIHGLSPNESLSHSSSVEFTTNKNLICDFDIIDSSIQNGVSRATLQQTKVTINSGPALGQWQTRNGPYTYTFQNTGSLPIGITVETQTKTISGAIIKTTTKLFTIASTNVETLVMQGIPTYYCHLEIHIIEDTTAPNTFKTTCNMLPPGSKDNERN